jgi:4-azaleucine resistance transporter AzlC
LKAGIPVILGFVPVGIAYAIMAGQAGFTPVQTVLMSLTVFAGASQMMACGMIMQGAGLIAIILATFILNLRHLIMSTCVFERMQDSPAGLRLLAAFGVTDEGFAIFTTEKKENDTVWFYLGLVLVTYVSWFAGSAIGALTSEVLPPMISASLGVALYAMFIGLLVPNLKGNMRLAVLAAVTACLNTVLTRLMAPSWALIVSTLVCAAAGTFFVDLQEDKRDE